MKNKIVSVLLIMLSFCWINFANAGEDLEKIPAVMVLSPQIGETILTSKIPLVGKVGPNVEKLFVEINNSKPQEIFLSKDKSFACEYTASIGKQSVSFIAACRDNKHKYVHLEFFSGLKINFNIGKSFYCKNDMEMETFQPIFLKNNRTMVPYYFFEDIGATISFVIDPNGDNILAIIFTKNGKTVIVKVESRDLFVDQKKLTMDVSPEKINGTIFVPVRFIAESFGCKVDWNGNEKEVIVSYLM